MARWLVAPRGPKQSLFLEGSALLGKDPACFGPGPAGAYSPSKMSHRLLSRAAVLVVGVFAAACAGNQLTLETRFAREESCEGFVHVKADGNQHFIAEGCGKQVDYICEGGPQNGRGCQRAGLPPPPGSSVGPPPRYPRGPRLEESRGL